MTDSFLDPRLTERRNPRTADIDRASALEIVDRINQEDASIPGVVAGARESIAQAVDLLETCLRAGGGTSQNDARANPSAGNGYWYLARARHTCGAGTYGGTWGTANARGGLNASGPCP